MPGTHSRAGVELASMQQSCANEGDSKETAQVPTGQNEGGVASGIPCSVQWSS